MPCGVWTSILEAPQVASPYVAVQGDVSIDLPGLGFVVTPDGVNAFRVRVDLDGALTRDFLGAVVPPQPPYVTRSYDCLEFGADILFSTPGTGVVVWPQATSPVANRIRVDAAGIIISEGFLVSSWVEWVDELLVTFDATGRLVMNQDLFIVPYGRGLVVPTLDGLHTYRIRVDTDGTPVSEGLT